jgi:DNA mismatch endonuclease (patch repair protein)
MRRIVKRDTKPEVRVRKLLHRMGLRFRLHRKDLPGTPDIVLPGRRKAVFVHGCFWHQHEGCRLARQPKTRLNYWLPKLARNIARDALFRQKLAEAGWDPIVIWECETQDTTMLEPRLKALLLNSEKV